MQFKTFALAALSLGSAIAAPALPVDLPVGGLAGFDQVFAAVAEVKTTVEKQVTSIEGVLSVTDGVPVVGEVKTSLLSIATNLGGLLGPVGGLAELDQKSLSDEQVAKIPEFLTIFKGITVQIKTITKKISGGVSDEGLEIIRPELQLVLSTVAPVTRPVLGFVTTAVPATSPIMKEVAPMVSELEGVVATVLTPVTSLLSLGNLGGGLL
ncbi:hypothetical protein GGS20DRAFT_552546 [Poronia punctata]|nr:hypothetical protein GGS20DRAFT_552546 [Poronia punctata]